MSEMESVWLQVCSMSQCIGVNIDKSTTAAAFDCLKSYKVDGYDALLLESMKANRVSKIITDDSDFGTVTGIDVYTCNQVLIEEARAQGKLKE